VAQPEASVMKPAFDTMAVVRRAGILAGLLALCLAAPGCGKQGASRETGRRSLPVRQVALTFERLSGFTVPDPGEAETFNVPPEIRKLNGRRVAITGYMIPLDFEEDGTSRFILLRDAPEELEDKVPRVNEWIDVTVAGGRRVPYHPGRPVEVTGQLEVREETDNGNAIGLYFLAAEEVIPQVDS
jgi:hypothetical protein